MEALVKRNAVQSQIAKLLTAVNKHDTNPLTPIAVSIHLDRLAKLSDEADDVYYQIVALCKDEAEAAVAEQVSDKVTEKLIAIKSVLLNIQTEQRVVVQQPAGAGGTAKTAVKLPAIELPVFDGSYENWTSFQDLFIATVHNNRSLSGAQKLQYLKTSLKGDAANVIKSMQVTDANYTQAWGLLTDRYENNREIVTSQLKKLFSQSSLTKESVSDLQKLYDTTNECVRALTVLGRPVDQWDDILVFLVVERMDTESRRAWAMTLKNTNLPTYKQLSEFIEQHVRGLLAGGNVKTQSVSNKSNNNSSHKTVSHHGATQETKCVVCNGIHPIYKCQQFLAVSPNERVNLVKRNNLCYNCLRGDHSQRACKSEKSCKVCNKQHNTLLHYDRRPVNQNATNCQGAGQSQPVVPPLQNQNATNSRGAGQSQPVVPPVHLLFVGNCETQVLLSTAIVRTRDQTGTERECRVLLDGGSQSSFISENCMKSLGLRRQQSSATVEGLGSIPVGSVRGRVKLTLSSRVKNATVNIEALILPKVTGLLPSYPCPSNEWTHIHDLQLADPRFYEPGPVDMLLGADVFAEILRDGRREGPKQTPIALNTIFGWILSGRVRAANQPIIKVHHANLETETVLRKFWELENSHQ